MYFPHFLFNKEPKAMTCRFELEFNGQPYPKSCPTCGLGGKCTRGYEQITNGDHTPGYMIKSPDSEKLYVSSNSPQYVKDSIDEHNKGLIAQGAVNDTFERVNSHQVATDIANTTRKLSDEQVIVIATNRRLAAIGYIAENFDSGMKLTVQELDAHVDRLARILLGK